MINPLFERFYIKRINITRPLKPNKRTYKRLLNYCISKGYLTNNSKFVRKLENDLSFKYDYDPLILTSNGTVALQVLLSSLKKDQNNLEIIVPSYTFVATISAIINSGFIPKFVDVKKENGTIDPKKVQDLINNKTKAIMGVHLFGNPCDHISLEALARKNSLKLFFDASHAFEVRQNNKPIINYGDGSTLSFHATKVFTTGEGGAIVSSNMDIINFSRNFINHGIDNESVVSQIGCNGKMSELNAIYGLSTIDIIQKAIKKRKNIYESYIRFFLKNNIKFEKILDTGSCTHNYSYAPFCFENKEIRDGLYNYLRDNKIYVRKYFSPLVSEFEPFKKYLTKDTDLSVSKYFADHILCLPIQPYLSYIEMNYIFRKINSFFKYS